MALKITVEVAYVDPQLEFFQVLELNAGATAEDAIQASGLLAQKPELALDSIGIFGKVIALTQVLKNNDRVEVYRPLVFDPKEARRKRAAQKAK